MLWGPIKALEHRRLERGTGAPGNSPMPPPHVHKKGRTRCHGGRGGGLPAESGAGLWEDRAYLHSIEAQQVGEDLPLTRLCPQLLSSGFLQLCPSLGQIGTECTCLHPRHSASSRSLHAPATLWHANRGYPGDSDLGVFLSAPQGVVPFRIKQVPRLNFLCR